MFLDQIGVPSWTPDSEESCQAWYKYNTDQNLINDDECYEWLDQTSYNRHMVQGVDAERPTKGDGEDYLTLDSSVDQHLQLAGVTQITLDETFTIGMRLNVDTTNGTVIGSNTTSGEIIKFASAVNILVKIDNTARTLTSTEGDFGNNRIIITRTDENLISVYVDGALQEDTAVLSGTADINALGIRAPNTNGYDGAIYDITIFNSASEQLTNNLEAYLQTVAPA